MFCIIDGRLMGARKLVPRIGLQIVKMAQEKVITLLALKREGTEQLFCYITAHPAFRSKGYTLRWDLRATDCL